MNDTNAIDDTTTNIGITETDMVLTQTLFCERGQDLATISKILGTNQDALYKSVLVRRLAYGGELSVEHKNVRDALVQAGGSVAGALKALENSGKGGPTAVTVTAWARKYGWETITRSRTQLSGDQWAIIQARWEAGEPAGVIADDFPIKEGSISTRAYSKTDPWDKANRSSSRGRASSLSAEQMDDLMQAYDVEMAGSGNLNMAYAVALIAIGGSLSHQSVVNTVKKQIEKADADAKAAPRAFAAKSDNPVITKAAPKQPVAPTSMTTPKMAGGLRTGGLRTKPLGSA